ncbi:ral guanine nucleotide dissociation stimulator-like [Dipodomys merriami]|uniref:ral guanine nucleotide dissociation stimulator-like n=1 Tax=Dipodomys merriami TaxID=94247 RepID=UPI0038517EE9
MFIHAFLNTYREVADTPQVLDLLFTRFSTCEAPMCPSGQTDTLAHSCEDVIPRDQLCHAITCLLGSWLDLHPEDFLAPAQLPCLQRLLTQLRLHMPDSDMERHVSHVLA